MLFPVEIYPKSSYKFIDLSSYEYFLRDSEQREEFVRIFTKKTFSEFRAQSTGAQRKILDDLVSRVDSTYRRQRVRYIGYTLPNYRWLPYG